jgi:hypothetical protein
MTVRLLILLAFLALMTFALAGAFAELVRGRRPVLLRRPAPVPA